jgi:hypothetical protein
MQLSDVAARRGLCDITGRSSGSLGGIDSVFYRVLVNYARKLYVRDKTLKDVTVN